MIRSIIPICLLLVLMLLTGDAAAQTNQSGNTADLRFLDSMMHHHSMGIEMARTAVDKAQNDGVKAFAQKAIDDQTRDNEEMQKMRDSHFAGQPKQEIVMMGKKEMSMPTMQKMHQDHMKQLESASGAAFDSKWLDMFTMHHQMAIDMSRSEVSKGSDAEVKRKAQEIIDKQTKDIAEMKRLKAQVSTKTAKTKTSGK